jgi:hypothetical protein
MEEKFKNLSELLGQNGKVEESPKSIKKQEETFFNELIVHLCQIEAVGAVLQVAGIHADRYENSFYKALEMLMIKHYGEMKASIILWWVFDSLTPDGEVYPLIDEDGKKHMIKTPTQLYKFIKRYDKK